MISRQGSLEYQVEGDKQVPVGSRSWAAVVANVAVKGKRINELEAKP